MRRRLLQGPPLQSAGVSTAVVRGHGAARNAGLIAGLFLGTLPTEFIKRFGGCVNHDAQCYRQSWSLAYLQVCAFLCERSMQPQQIMRAERGQAARELGGEGGGLLQRKEGRQKAEKQRDSFVLQMLVPPPRVGNCGLWNV